MNVVIFVTAANKKEAEKIACALIKEKLAACANIIENLHSIFWWQGKVDRSKEALLIVKSKASKFSRIVRLVKSIHSYEVPEIIALPIVCGEKKYLRWLDASIRKPA